MEGSARITDDHAEIRWWVESHKGTPQIIDDPHVGGEPVGLRIGFGNDADTALLGEARRPRELSWNEFFRMFEKLGLSFVYEIDSVQAGDPSVQYRFIKRDVASSLPDIITGFGKSGG